MYDFGTAFPGFLPQTVIDRLRNAAAEAEQAGRLTHEQLQLIYDNNWFNLFVPEHLGGLFMELPRAIRTLEALACIDGSVGWTVTLCSGASWFVGFLDPVINARLFTGRPTCFAGSGAATGIAVMEPAGFRINGSWKYVTGAPFASVFTANCVLKENNAGGCDGDRVVRPFIFFPDEVKIDADWYGTGMRATASYSISVHDKLIPHDRIFQLENCEPVIHNPRFTIPFLQFAEITLAANFSGMTFHFLKLCSELLDQRIKNNAYNTVQVSEMLEALGRMKATYEHYRNDFLEALNHAWEKAKTENQWFDKDLMQLSACSYRLAKNSVRVVDTLFPYCGMQAADTRSTLNRIWRDIHTASQHALFMFQV